MIKEQYVTFKTATLAKEKGFNESIGSWYFTNLKSKKQSHILGFGGIGLGSFINEFLDNESFEKKFNNDDENYISAPTQSLLSRWLREEKNICMEIYVSGSGFMWALFDINAKIHKADSNCTGPNSGGRWDSHEEAMEDALQKALSLI